MSKVIELNSIKLPRDYTEFKDRVTGNAAVTMVNVSIHAHVEEPFSKIDLNGYIQAHTKKKPILRKSLIRYSGTFEVTDNPYVNLGAVYKSIEESLRDNKLKTFKVNVTRARIMIDGKVYQFKHHTSAKALMLNQIDNKPIGKVSRKRVEELINSDFHFCQPSRCRVVWKEAWDCE